MFNNYRNPSLFSFSSGDHNSPEDDGWGNQRKGLPIAPVRSQHGIVAVYRYTPEQGGAGTEMSINIAFKQRPGHVIGLRVLFGSVGLTPLVTQGLGRGQWQLRVNIPDLGMAGSLHPHVLNIEVLEGGSVIDSVYCGLFTYWEAGVCPLPNNIAQHPGLSRHHSFDEEEHVGRITPFPALSIPSFGMGVGKEINSAVSHKGRAVHEEGTDDSEEELGSVFHALKSISLVNQDDDRPTPTSSWQGGYDSQVWEASHISSNYEVARPLLERDTNRGSEDRISVVKGNQTITPSPNATPLSSILTVHPVSDITPAPIPPPLGMDSFMSIDSLHTTAASQSIPAASIAAATEEGSILSSASSEQIASSAFNQRIMSDVIDISDLDLADNITVGEQITWGGFSNIYDGTLTINDTEIKVALKSLRVQGNAIPQTKERLRKRFYREILLWRKLHHPNIVPLLGYMILASGLPTLISPWYINGNVIEYLAVNPTADRLILALNVTDGLRYLHSIPVAHGDLKGENVLVNGEGCASLCDFGMSQFIDETSKISGFTTTNANSGGTDRFLCPEQVLEDALKSAATDMWAVGCLIVQILTDVIPYQHLTGRSAVLSAIMRGLPPMEKNNGKFDGTLWECIKKCWSKKQDERPLASDIRDLIREMAG